jgi:hypothetical protein
MALTEDFADFTELVSNFSFRVKAVIKEDESILQENTFFDGFAITSMERHSVHLPSLTTITVGDAASGQGYTHCFIFSSLPVAIRVTGALFLDVEVAEVLCFDWAIGHQTIDITAPLYAATDTLPNVEILMVRKAQ